MRPNLLELSYHTADKFHTHKRPDNSPPANPSYNNSHVFNTRKGNDHINRENQKGRLILFAIKRLVQSFFFSGSMKLKVMVICL